MPTAAEAEDKAGYFHVRFRMLTIGLRRHEDPTNATGL